jgi:hypothetical protein
MSVKPLLATLASLAVILALGGPAWATVTADDNCAENPLVVDDGPAGPKAQRVANGYVCPTTDLVINTSLNVTDPTLDIRARSITVATLGDPTDPSQRVQIVNNFPDSTTSIVAVTGNLTFNGAIVKAHKTLRLECDGVNPPPGCKIESDNSELVAATDFTNPAGGGVFLITAVGPVDIQTTTLHGGDALEVQSNNSDIKLICKSGDTTCVDPTRAAGTPGGTVEAACGLPPQFPCTVTFQTPQELKGVCIGAPGVKCNGGHKEKRFTAQNGVIDITDSRIDSIEHVTFTAKKFKGARSILTAESIVINITGGATASDPAVVPAIDITDAQYVTDFQLTIKAGTGCPADNDPAAPNCVVAKGFQGTASPLIISARTGGAVIDLCKSATQQANLNRPGTGFPQLNNDATPPYTTTGVDRTLESDAECGGAGTGAIIN